MKRTLYPAGALLIGMAVSHLLFTVLIYSSNLLLHEKVTALKDAGYLVVPNEYIAGSLTGLFPAFCGALFFTLTIGAGLSLLAFAGAWVHVRWMGTNRFFSGILLIMWMAFLAAVNAEGFNLTATLAVFFIPLLPYFLTRWWIPPYQGSHERFSPVIHIAVVLVVAAIWIPRLDGGVFINVRDLLLLEHTAGKAVNSFYYRYTLYPADLFKTLDQKMLKTVCIEDIKISEISEKLKIRLAAYDYLPVSRGAAPCDVYISQEGPRLSFSGKNYKLQSTLAAFLAEPGAILKDFSQKNDVNGFFRLMTLAFLVSAFPLSLYIIVQALFVLVLGVVIRPVFLRSVIASGLCMAVGIASAMPLYAAPPEGLMKPSKIQQQLRADDWRAQRRALQAISNQKRDPFDFRLDWEMVRSPHVALRYWLVQSLGNSKHPDAMPMLLEFIDDPQPNVACMAYYGLGRNGSRQAVDEILSRIPDIRHWYIQWYAYKSLKRLGWVQKLPDTAHSSSPLQ